VPLGFLALGSVAIARREVYVGCLVEMRLYGLNAVAFGLAWVGAVLFVHCHYFWGNVYNQAWFAVLGKIGGAFVFIAGLGVVLVRSGVLGIR
jgi:hypothetical protein